jgi:hypothetical protein
VREVGQDALLQHGLIELDEDPLGIRQRRAHERGHGGIELPDLQRRADVVEAFGQLPRRHRFGGARTGGRPLELVNHAPEIARQGVAIDRRRTRFEAEHVNAVRPGPPDDVDVGDELRIARQRSPLLQSICVLHPVVLVGILHRHPHRQADLGEVSEQVEVPVDHRELESVGQADTGGVARLLVPPVLHDAEGNDDHGRRHDGRCGAEPSGERRYSFLHGLNL